MIFKYKEMNFVLVENVPVCGNLKRTLKNELFEIKQIYQIDLKKWDKKEYRVFEFKKIKSHCMLI